MIYSMDLAGRVTHFTFRLGTTCSIGIARSRAYFVLRNVEGRQYTMLPQCVTHVRFKLTASKKARHVLGCR